MAGTHQTPGDESADVVEADMAETDVVEADTVSITDDPDRPVDGDVAEVIVVDDDPVAAVVAERDEYLDALRRLQAEFENYRKRVSKQQADQVERAAVSLVDKLLPVLDVLDLAADHLGDAESNDGKALVQASALLNDVLAKEGLERIDPEGELFDPNSHEAVGNAPADEAGADGDEVADSDGPVVAQVMRPGYRWRGTIVRPAMVLVRS